MSDSQNIKKKKHTRLDWAAKTMQQKTNNEHISIGLVNVHMAPPLVCRKAVLMY